MSENRFAEIEGLCWSGEVWERGDIRFVIGNRKFQSGLVMVSPQMRHSWEE